MSLTEQSRLTAPLAMSSVRTTQRISASCLLNRNPRKTRLGGTLDVTRGAPGTRPGTPEHPLIQLAGRLKITRNETESQLRTHVAGGGGQAGATEQVRGHGKVTVRGRGEGMQKGDP